MKPLTLMTGCMLISVLLFNACSKSVSPTPVIQPPVDSTNLPGDGGGDGDGENETPLSYAYEFYDIPVLDQEAASQLFLGEITTKIDAKSLMEPSFTLIADSLRNLMNIYTDIPMDDFALDGVPASRASDNQLLKNIQQELDKGVGQIPSVASTSAVAFKQRFNSLRGILGINQDLNALFDLGFTDTTRLANDKGRAMLSFKVIKASIMSEPPIYKDFFKMDTSSATWKELFGTANPLMVTAINYGASVTLVMESDSTAEKLRLALNNCFEQPIASIIDESAFGHLSAEDQQIIKGSKGFGYAVGQGSFPHEGQKAVAYYAKLFQQVLDPHTTGHAISFNLHDPISFNAFKLRFAVTRYPQGGKD